MKQCPGCIRTFPDDAMLLCPYDGSPLINPFHTPNALEETRA